MIPKIIHYCWFGRNPLPDSARQCIDSWRKSFPDYEIREWNEDNFDVNSIPYTAEAYAAGKYAFVSDYARFLILYREGGVYFDTDVEVIRPMDDLLERGPFMGVEVPCGPRAALPMVNPGLGIAAPSGMDIFAAMLEYYRDLHFINADGSQNTTTVVQITTEVLQRHGLRPTNEIQQVAGVWVYPAEYFNPLNANTGVLKVAQQTRSIHWYSKSWLPHQSPLRTWVVQHMHRWFGDSCFAWLKKTK